MNKEEQETAIEFLDIYLGGNMYIKTLTPIALADFAESYHKRKLKYKEQETLKFAEWCNLNKWDYYGDIWSDIDIINPNGKKKTTAELLELFRQEQLGK